MNPQEQNSLTDAPGRGGKKTPPAENSPARRMALFGGTFDPVHEGHLHIASLAREAFQLDQIRWLPCWISPHKLDRLPAPAEDRIRMLELATAACPWSVVDSIEIDRGGPSYSVDTATEISRRFPNDRLFWIMGTDQWKVLPTWAKATQLARLVEFIVVGRGEPAWPREGYLMHPLHAEHPASATEIRRAIATGAKPGWLSAPVMEWIRSHNLYQIRS